VVVVLVAVVVGGEVGDEVEEVEEKVDRSYGSIVAVVARRAQNGGRLKEGE
jgi:hypothetical protein